MQYFLYFSVITVITKKDQVEDNESLGRLVQMIHDTFNIVENSTNKCFCVELYRSQEKETRDYMVDRSMLKIWRNIINPLNKRIL